MSDWFDLVGAVLLLCGAFLCLVAAVALIRFPDLLAKLHAITKPQVLGLLFLAAGVFVSMRTWWVFAICTLAVALQLVTAPVAATMVSRAAHRRRLVEHRKLVVDDLTTDLERAGYRADHDAPQ